MIAQLSDVHIGVPVHPAGAQLTAAVDAVNAMTRRPDLVLFTGDLTHSGADDEWHEFTERANELRVPWHAIPGNHDRNITQLLGHRTIDLGALRLVLLDTSSDAFTDDDAAWLDRELAAEPDRRTVIAVHHPPFETGIWWMDCAGLDGSERLEAVVRAHQQVVQVVSGHVHRPIVTQWGTCALWVSPSTAMAVAMDLDPGHEPAESAEPPNLSLHVYTDAGIVSHLVPIGDAAVRTDIEPYAPEFVRWARERQRERMTTFG